MVSRDVRPVDSTIKREIEDAHAASDDFKTDHTADNQIVLATENDAEALAPAEESSFPKWLSRPDLIKSKYGLKM